MIVGLLLFFAFLFVLYIGSGAQLAGLSGQKEEAASKIFKKESFRLYVDDCLQDELTQGLLLLGRQGTLWSDQPGGIKKFSEGVNGITFGEERIAYALTDESYAGFPRAYPCGREENPPAFCNYRYPNTSVGFGTTRLFPSTFTSDLRQYLLDRTSWCVQNFILANVSEHAEIIPTEIKLDLDLTEEGVGVKVNYPLKFKVGREELFQLSTFDFFYPSHFKQLLEVASKPLEWEQKLIDFNYSGRTLAQPAFSYGSEIDLGSCTAESNYFQCLRSLAADAYQSLGILLATENVAGDDLFTFTPALYEIVNSPRPYRLNIARQNRPPALDYIERAACPEEGYDYLVIKGSRDYGDITIRPHAIDPDEDTFSFTFSGDLGGQNIRTSEDVLANIPSGRYTLTTIVADEHGKSDGQEVRILVDRPIDVRLGLEFPPSYGLQSFIGGGGESDVTPLYVVSREDPLLLQATIPAYTETSNVQTIALNYFDGVSETALGRLDYDHPGISSRQCYTFPRQRENAASDAPLCIPGVPLALDSYYNTDDKINRITEPDYYQIHPFRASTTRANPGTLSLNFNTQYCGLPPEEQQSRIHVLVADCAPVRNPEHPFAYPYHGYTFDAEGNFIENDPAAVNPFEATHSCCLGNPGDPRTWKIATPEDGPCFVNPQPGCYGGLLGFTSGTNKGYVLEKEEVLCRGSRGNVCDGEKRRKLYNDEMRCGTNGENECSGIEERCAGQLAFSFIPGGWCSGKMGCADFCTSAAVYQGVEERPSFTNEEINQLAIEAQGDLSSFSCGCAAADDGKYCDANFDGRFSGSCNGVVCTE